MIKLAAIELAVACSEGFEAFPDSLAFLIAELMDLDQACLSHPLRIYAGYELRGGGSSGRLDPRVELDVALLDARALLSTGKRPPYKALVRDLASRLRLPRAPSIKAIAAIRNSDDYKSTVSLYVRSNSRRKK